MSDISVEYVYEYWDCPKCGQKAIRGDIKSCSNCGNPRDEDINFYRKDSEEKVENEEQLNEFKAGADWGCSFCGTLNSPLSSQCKSCGNTKSSSDKNYFEIQARKDKKKKKKVPDELLKDENRKGLGKITKIILGTVIFIIISFIGLIIWGMQTQDVDFKVTEVKWEREIIVDRYTRLTKNDWKGSLSGDKIEIISEREEIKGYEDRQVGTKMETYQESESYKTGSKKECSTSYESTGSGASKKVTKCNNVPVYSKRNITKTRTVPVYKKFPIYDTKVKYQSNSYTFYKNHMTSGSDNNPVWANFQLGTGLENKADRESSREEKYEVVLEKIDPAKKGPQTEKYEVKKEEEFRNKYILNSTITLKVNNFGEIEKVKDNESTK